jgi:cation:H+ antiporter
MTAVKTTVIGPVGSEISVGVPPNRAAKQPHQHRAVEPGLGAGAGGDAEGERHRQRDDGGGDAAEEASAGRVTWQAGLALLFALVINTIWETRTAREEQAEDHDGIDPADAHGGYGPALIRLAGGLGLLVWGSQILVKGASAIALGLGVSQTLIGLTVVAAGTSMPELVTSIMAAIRGKTDLAIGNVVGSNLLNQLLILGSCAFVSGGRGLSVDPALIRSDLPIMVATTVALLPIFWTGGEISRREGVLLVGLYGLYMVEQILPLTAPDLASPLRSFSLFVVIPVLVALLAIRVWHHWHQDQREAWQDN